MPRPALLRLRSAALVWLICAIVCAVSFAARADPAPGVAPRDALRHADAPASEMPRHVRVTYAPQAAPVGGRPANTHPTSENQSGPFDIAGARAAAAAVRDTVLSAGAPATGALGAAVAHDIRRLEGIMGGSFDDADMDWALLLLRRLERSGSHEAVALLREFFRLSALAKKLEQRAARVASGTASPRLFRRAHSVREVADTLGLAAYVAMALSAAVVLGAALSYLFVRTLFSVADALHRAGLPARVLLSPAGARFLCGHVRHHYTQAPLPNVRRSFPPSLFVGAAHADDDALGASTASAPPGAAGQRRGSTAGGRRQSTAAQSARRRSTLTAPLPDKQAPSVSRNTQHKPTATSALHSAPMPVFEPIVEIPENEAPMHEVSHASQINVSPVLVDEVASSQTTHKIDPNSTQTLPQPAIDVRSPEPVSTAPEHLHAKAYQEGTAGACIAGSAAHLDTSYRESTAASVSCSAYTQAKATPPATISLQTQTTESTPIYTPKARASISAIVFEQSCAKPQSADAFLNTELLPTHDSSSDDLIDTTSTYFDSAPAAHTAARHSQPAFSLLQDGTLSTPPSAIASPNKDQASRDAMSRRRSDWVRSMAIFDDSVALLPADVVGEITLPERTRHMSLAPPVVPDRAQFTPSPVRSRASSHSSPVSFDQSFAADDPDDASQIPSFFSTPSPEGLRTTPASAQSARHVRFSLSAAAPAPQPVPEPLAPAFAGFDVLRTADRLFYSDASRDLFGPAAIAAAPPAERSILSRFLARANSISSDSATLGTVPIPIHAGQPARPAASDPVASGDLSPPPGLVSVPAVAHRKERSKSFAAGVLPAAPATRTRHRLNNATIFEEA